MLGLLAIPHLGAPGPLDAGIAEALRERLGFTPGFRAVRIEPGRRLVLRGVSLGEGGTGEPPPAEVAEVELPLDDPSRGRGSAIRLRGARIRAESSEALARLRRLRPRESGAPIPRFELRDSTILLAGGLEVRVARGSLVTGEAGVTIRLEGTLAGPGLEGSGVVIETDEEGRHLAAQAGDLRFHPAGVEVRVEDLGVIVRSVGDGSRIGTVHASRFWVRGIPGEEISAQLGSDGSGLWSATAISGTLAGGTLAGRAAYAPGGERPVSADLSLRDASLAWVPPLHLGGRAPLRGTLDLLLAGLEWGPGDLRGDLTASARDVQLAETPLFLGLLSAVQFQAESRPVFASAEARASLERARLRFSRLRLAGEALSLDLADGGTVGWDGAVALPFRVSGAASLFKDLPIFGEVLGATAKAVPIELRTSLGGSLRVPRVSLATGLRMPGSEDPPRGR